MLSAGTHSFRAIVYDAVGQQGESSVSFIVSSGTGTFTINAPVGAVPAGPITVSASYSGSGAPQNVKLYVDGVFVANMSGSGNGPYTGTWNATVGSHTISVQDSKGSSGSKTVEVV